MNILVPMAGSGSRFGVKYPPKPLIEIKNKTMIENALESLNFPSNMHYIFCIRSEIKEKFSNLEFLSRYNHSIIEVNKLTEGCASTCLLAVEKINNHNPLFIMNCDQIMKWDGKKFVDYCINSHSDGVIVTYSSTSPKNSFVKLDSNGYVCEVAEKKVISNLSTNGISYWKTGKDFVESCILMISNNDRVNNEFYVAPSYNYLIKNGKKIKNYHIPKEEHFPVGTPEDLETYINGHL